MKKITLAFALLFVLSISSFGDEGDSPVGGGKTCPNGQTVCREMPDDGFIKFINDWLIDLIS